MYGEELRILRRTVEFGKCRMIATAVICCILSVPIVQAQKIKKTIPVSAATWSVDLRGDGRDTPLVDFDSRFRLKMFHTDLSFLNDREMVDTFLANEVEGGRPKTEGQRILVRMHAVFLDPASGQVQRHLSWPTTHGMSWLVPRADGSFVVFLGDRLEFYSADFAPRSELKLSPVPGHGQDSLWFSSSPSGRTILIQYNNGSHISCVWVNDEVISSQQEQCELSMGAVISDAEVATVQRTEGNGRINTRISVKTFQGPWRTLCTSGWAACSQPEFVTDDTLLLWPGMSYLLRLVRSDGKTTFLGPGGKLRTGLYVHSFVEKPHLLAFPIYEAEEGTDPELDSVLVYNVFTRKRIFEIKVDEPKNRIRLLQGLAISPRGDRLAIEGDWVLRCYALPPAEN
jgi:hypothetical protein